MTEHPIVGDGNCQFRAVAWAMTGSEDSHATMRESVVAETIAAADEYEQYIDLNQTLATWSANMRRSGVDGDHITLAVMARMTGRPIVVWRRGFPAAPTT
eukprot:4904731-Heterocapsa_arctica.AAC.1